ncbi:protease FtsH subunit HflK [Desulfobaculum bizertense DSM 18034]|uniref:Protein HflK n=2 Tax=Desulfobaculum TaxID=1433996 RepID=A0A1T4VG09_9BACT|nr:protease FtsH subunit HflK [Desulfobaculum bizertense DSM 18034]
MQLKEARRTAVSGLCITENNGVIMNWDWEKLQEKRKTQPGGGGGGPQLNDVNIDWDRFRNFRFPAWRLLLGLIVLGWLASGIYIVGPDEIGVVQRFGAYSGESGPGPHYHLPFPIERVQTPKVTQIRRVEVGLRSTRRSGNFSQASFQDVPQESLMLTGDENIVDVQFIVQYLIKDARDYLFNVKNQEESVKNIAEAAMREIIGRSRIDSVLTSDKLVVQTEAKTLMQDMSDKYKLGVRIVAVQLQNVHPPKEVIDAFKDVASAREDKSRFINEAEAYKNDILPKARGQAAVLVNEAEAYKQQQIRRAEGEAARFLSVYTEYAKAKDITRRRMYLETMEKIFSSKDMEKILMSSDALRGAVPYLPLSPLGHGTRVLKGGE